MGGPLGVVGGPVPTGGPPPKNSPLGANAPTNKPIGVMPNTVAVVPVGQPNAGPGPVGVQTNVSVTPNISPAVPPWAQMQGTPTGSAQTPGHLLHNQANVQSVPAFGLALGASKGAPVGWQMPAPAQGFVSPHFQGAWRDRKKLWKDMGQVVVSAVLSIHNRSKLFRRALYGYLWQTMPAESWEIILLDDCSTEDLSETYKPLLSRINLRHVKFDHRKHPLWKAKNGSFVQGQKENWYHTPALTINLGIHMARGPIICLCHPEILHAPENFELAAVRLLRENAYLFGTTYLGTQDSNRWLDRNPSWVNFGWQGFLSRVAGHTLEKYSTEKYWYLSFLPRIAARKIGGVDFQYMNGVAGEDDDFRDRVDMAGWSAIHAPELEGLHQDHSDEQEAHRIRTTPEWKDGLARNRSLYRHRKDTGNFPIPANVGVDWTAQEGFIQEIRYRIGSREPEIITKV